MKKNKVKSGSLCKFPIFHAPMCVLVCLTLIQSEWGRLACGAGGISSAKGIYLQMKNTTLFQRHCHISPAHRYSWAPFCGAFDASAGDAGKSGRFFLFSSTGYSHLVSLCLFCFAKAVKFSTLYTLLSGIYFNNLQTYSLSVFSICKNSLLKIYK